MTSEYPKFRIDEIQDDDEAALLGSLTTIKYGDQTWIKNGWFGCLVREGMAVYGRWRAHGQSWAFIPENRQWIDSFKCGTQWDVLDGYWGERAGIVLDMSRQWRKVRFEPSDAVEVRGDKTRWRIKHLGLSPEKGILSRAAGTMSIVQYNGRRLTKTIR